MFDVASSLVRPLQTASDALQEAASVSARAATTIGPASSDRAMAGVAQRELFAEVLLNAVHARLAELKNVTHQ